MVAKSVLLALLGTTAIRGAESLGCLNGEGKSEDFWYGFKFPDGWDYAYMDKTHKLEKVDGTMDDDGSALTRTLMQVYGKENRESLSLAMWNDEHDDGKQRPAPHAHAKGVFAWDGEAGFWLSHSVPKFPSSSGGHPFDSAKDPRYAQSFLCVDLTKEAVETLGDIFSTSWVSVYESQDNAGLGETFTKWATVDGKTHSEDPPTLYKSFKSKAGQTFHIFAKSGSYEHALYDEVVAPQLKKDLYTQTWMNGRGKDASFCTGDYTVENIAEIKMPGYSGKKGEDTWTTTKDHSKWVVTTDGGTFCVGDINRQVPQLTRGGGTTCIMSKPIAEQMLAVVASTESCKGLNVTQKSTPIVV